MAFDQAIGEKVCEHIASGLSMTKACDAVNVNPTTPYDWFAKSPQLAEKYARAVAVRADRKADRVDELAEKCAAGEVDPQAARVAIDAHKWTASKLAPKKYGDRIQSDIDMQVTVTVQNPFALPVEHATIAADALPALPTPSND